MRTSARRFGICRFTSFGARSADALGEGGKCRRSLKRFENWRFKPWGAHVEIKRALNIVVAPKCVLMWGRNCRDACRDRNKREYRKVQPRQWWQPGSTGCRARLAGLDADELEDAGSSPHELKKNRKSRLGWVCRPRPGRPTPRASTSRASPSKSGRGVRGFACE